MLGPEKQKMKERGLWEMGGKGAGAERCGRGEREGVSHKLEGSFERVGSCSPLSCRDPFLSAEGTEEEMANAGGWGREPEDVWRGRVTRPGPKLYGFPRGLGPPPMSLTLTPPPPENEEKLETDSREEECGLEVCAASWGRDGCEAEINLRSWVNRPGKTSGRQRGWSTWGGGLEV